MLLQGDCLTQLQNLEANSVDSIVTDPPYGLGFMGKQWDSLPPGQEVFEQCLRVLKPGGHLLCFGGSRTYHRMAVAVEDAGFEIRDQIMWVYGSGFPKSYNVAKGIQRWKTEGSASWNGTGDSSQGALGYSKLQHEQGYRPNDYSNAHEGGIEIKDREAKAWEGYGTALKPSHEPIVLARKPIEKGLSIAQNCLKWGVGAINVDGCRVESGSRPLIKSESEKAKNDYGNGLNGSKADGETTQGRFPANFIHDGSDEVVGLFPVTSSGALKPYKENHNNPSSYQFNREKDYISAANTGSAARFFYTPKAKKKERLTFNNHPTVKPVSLMQYLVRLITPAGGTCLDPFAGSGTTGLACMKEGRSYILIDADSQSLDIARRRLLSEIASQEWPLRNYDLL